MQNIIEIENRARIQLVNSRALAREREGEKRRGLSAHYPSPRSSTSEPPGNPKKWKIPSHKPQAESGGL